jgi:hypothetical protein
LTRNNKKKEVQMSKCLALISLTFVMFAAGVHAEPKEATTPSIEGAWKLVEVTSPDGVENPNPQPGVWMFTRHHYSLAMVMGTNVSVQPASVAQALGVKEISLWDAFVANSGSYSVTGNMLTTVPMVAEAKEAMTDGFVLKYEMKFDGNGAVALTTKVGGGVNSVWKLRRME